VRADKLDFCCGCRPQWAFRRFRDIDGWLVEEISCFLEEKKSIRGITGIIKKHSLQAIP
jgi:hypothetical protein